MVRVVSQIILTPLRFMQRGQARGEHLEKKIMASTWLFTIMYALGREIRMIEMLVRRWQEKEESDREKRKTR